MKFFKIINEENQFFNINHFFQKDGKNKVKIKRKNKKDYVPEHLSKEQDIRLKKGDKVQVQTPGGGGFGNPKKRKKYLIINDILEEKLSLKDAFKIYGKKII